MERTKQYLSNNSLYDWEARTGFSVPAGRGESAPLEEGTVAGALTAGAGAGAGPLAERWLLLVDNGDVASSAGTNFRAEFLTEGFIWIPLRSPITLFAACIAADNEAPKSYRLPKA